MAMKNQPVPILVYAFLSISMLYSGCKKVEQVTLTFNPSPGKKYEFTMAVNQEIEMNNYAQKTVVANNSVFVYDVEVKGGDGNNVLLNTFIKRIRINMGAGGAESSVNYDSDNPDSSNSPVAVFLSKIFNEITGKPISLTINEKGELVSLSGVQQVIDQLLADTAWNAMPNGVQAKEYIKRNFGEDFYKRSFSEMFNVLPGKEVAVGDTWEKHQGKILMEMKADTKMQNQLKAIDNNTAVVSVNGSVNLAAQGSQYIKDIEMAGTQTGNMKIDITTGLIIESDVKHEAEGVYTNADKSSFKLTGTTKITSREIK